MRAGDRLNNQAEFVGTKGTNASMGNRGQLRAEQSKKTECADRDSNPGHMLGKHVF